MRRGSGRLKKIGQGPGITLAGGGNPGYSVTAEKSIKINAILTGTIVNTPVFVYTDGGFNQHLPPAGGYQGKRKDCLW